MKGAQFLRCEGGGSFESDGSTKGGSLPEGRTHRSAQILGITFFNGKAAQAVGWFLERRGLMAIPASPALTKLRTDEAYRTALASADLVLLDSSLIASIWNLISAQPVAKISGSTYLRSLLADPSGERSGNFLWVVNSEQLKAQTIGWLQERGFPVGEEDFHLLPFSQVVENHELLLKIEARRPSHIIVATAGGGQEKLGLYLRDYLLYRPCIHCVGAALAFLTGAERPIPAWAERMRIGWLLRLASQPGMLLPRLGIVVALLRMLLRYRAELPPLRTRWADV